MSHVRRPLATLSVLLLIGGAAAAVVLGLGVFDRHQTGRAAHVVVPKPPPARVVKRIRRPRIVRGPHDRPVPILMYHVLGVPSAQAAYPDLFTSPKDLAAQMNWLAAHGYHAVTLGQVFRYWRAGIALPPRPIVLSFDDGYLSDYTVALPVLRRHGWAGVLNLIVDSVKPGDITADQVRALIAAGWEIDAHTVTHADLPPLGAAQLRAEVAGSRADLRKEFGQPVDFFCYPVGHYDRRVIAAVRAAGYLGATTETPGVARPSEAYTLPRIRMDKGDGVSGLATKLGRLHA
jgi:peptidoglycan/xylan/chitin deacetylase (PgdA/CDA1 family)